MSNLSVLVPMHIVVHHSQYIVLYVTISIWATRWHGVTEFFVWKISYWLVCFNFNLNYKMTHGVTVFAWEIPYWLCVGKVSADRFGVHLSLIYCMWCIVQECYGIASTETLGSTLLGLNFEGIKFGGFLAKSAKSIPRENSGMGSSVKLNPQNKFRNRPWSAKF